MNIITYLMCGLFGVLTVALTMLDPPTTYLIGAFYAGFGVGVLLCLYTEVWQKILEKLFKD